MAAERGAQFARLAQTGVHVIASHVRQPAEAVGQREERSIVGQPLGVLAEFAAVALLARPLDGGFRRIRRLVRRLDGGTQQARLVRDVDAVGRRRRRAVRPPRAAAIRGRLGRGRLSDVVGPFAVNPSSHSNAGSAPVEVVDGAAIGL
jgi:hypothetical protein